MTLDPGFLDSLFQFLPKNPIVYLLGFFLLWVMVMPEKVEKVREHLYWLLGGLGSAFRNRYHRIAIRNSLNPQIRTLESQLGLEERLPGVEIRFRRDAREPAYVDGSVVIFVRDPRSLRSENVAKVALAYVHDVLYRESRPYMSDTTGRALDLVLTKRLVQEDKDAFYFFTRSYIVDACKNDRVLNGEYEQLVACDKAGLLPGVLLHQLSLLTSRLFPLHTYSRDVQEEFRGFIRWLAGVARRDRGEPVTPFDIRYIRVGIILVGRDETLSEQGLIPYQRYFARLIHQGLYGAYILAAGNKVKLVKQLIEALESNEYFLQRISRAGVKETVKHFSVDRGLKIAVGYVPISPRAESSPEESPLENKG